MFFGQHERQLDGKGRVALPVAFRNELGEQCYLVFGDARCIEVHSKEAFEARALEIRDQVKRGDASVERQRALAHSATPVTFDRQGRVNLDERLRGFARIPLGSKVIITGNIDCVELWSEAVYQEVSESATMAMAGGGG